MYTVILVDDQPLCLQGMESGFNWEKYGFEVIYKTTNPASALAVIKDEVPDVVCTDMCMPNISGIDLIKAIKILNLKTKFIIVSGYEDFNYAREAIEYNVFRYCLKPLVKRNTDRVLEELKRILDAEHHKEPSVEQSIEQEKNASSVQNPKFAEMVHFINKNYKDDLSLNKLSNQFQINPSFASRLFSQYYNMGFSQYLNMIRLEKAAELLENTTVGIEEIAYMVGFNDSAYFGRVFKKKFNETPYVFRCRKKVQTISDK